MNLRFDCKEIRSGKHAYAALLMLHTGNRALAPATCIFLYTMKNYIFCMSPGWHFRVDSENLGYADHASAGVDEAYNEVGALASAPCIFSLMA